MVKINKPQRHKEHKGDSEPIFDLQNILHDLYDRASYDLVIDYTKKPVPALSNTDKDWLETFLRDNGLR